MTLKEKYCPVCVENVVPVCRKYRTTERIYCPECQFTFATQSLEELEHHKSGPIRGRADF